MTKRQEIESILQHGKVWCVANTMESGMCQKCERTAELLREYQSTLPPDFDDWEKAYRSITGLKDNEPISNKLAAANFRDGYLAAKNEKGGKG